MSSEQSEERAECNIDVLVRHDGAEIDKWMFSQVWGGFKKGEMVKWKEQSGYNYWLKRLKGLRGEETGSNSIQIKTG